MNKTHITILLILAGLLLAQVGYAQNEKQKQSLQYKSYSKKSRNKAEQLLNEANELKENNPKEALDKVEEALGVSLAQENEFDEGKAYVLLGIINENIQEWKLALENYNRAYQKLLPFTTTIEFRQTLRGLGVAHLKLNQYEEALKYFNEALQLSTDVNQREELQLHISEVHYQKGKYQEALNSLDRGKDGKETSQQTSDTRIQNQRAKIYARMNDISKTKDLYQSSVNTLRTNKIAKPEEQQSLQETKQEIAEVLREQKNYDDEITLRNQSVEYNLENNNLGEVASDKIEISKTLAAKGDNTAALKEIEEAAQIASTIDNPKEQANAYLALANQYESNGKTTQALSAYKKYSTAVAATEKNNEARLLDRSEIIRKQQAIEELTKDVSLGQREDTIEKATVFRQQLIIYGLSFIILIIAITSYFIYKNARASKLANQMLALKSLRSQMNPHFIFNALNSVNHFVAQQDERTANKFLSEFSRLMRLVLENSQEDFITLQKEQDILSLYLKLEHYRFRDKFDYEIETDNDINADAIEVPPMLIQPYIENAVWHGLRYKETKGKLLLRFQKKEEHIVVEIIDNGIGRKKSAELKTENQKKHHSTGLKNIEERLSIINKVYNSNYRVAINDLEEESGTRVQIYLSATNSIPQVA
jgi:tetratricopeptide (TPR) repeat protein